MPVEKHMAGSKSELDQNMAARNRALIKGLREDTNSDVSLKKVQNDTKLGRMLEPREIREEDVLYSVLSPRMCVEQGIGPDGAPKFRAVDDFTRSHMNACTEPTEKLSCDTLDAVVRTLRELSLKLDCPISMFKADIDSAFRRVPIAAEQRRYGRIVFKHRGVVLVAGHVCMPFGSVASVHNWDRIGSFLCALGRKLLKIPLSRYVDDFMAGDRKASIDAGMNCFARLVRACLGSSAVAADKLEAGAELVLLGVSVKLSRDGALLKPSADKVAKWSRQLKSFLSLGRLCGGEAAKLAGALQWAAQHTFKRLGRAMIRPIINQEHARSSDINDQLQLALMWWLEVLNLDIAQFRPWVARSEKPVHMFCDARSTPPRVAAVLYKDRKFAYCDIEPPAEILYSFMKREDNQITSLEILSIALGISTFAKEIAGRNLIIWSDNTGAESATRKGSTKQFDQNCLIHTMWKQLAVLNVNVWVERVPTRDNIADLPSRLVCFRVCVPWGPHQYSCKGRISTLAADACQMGYTIL